MLISIPPSSTNFQTQSTAPVNSTSPDKAQGEKSQQVSDQQKQAEDEKKSNRATATEQRELQQLKNRDREVRAHELAHVSVGGRYITSGANFSYEKGSNGQLYAVAGEVQINTSAVPGDPQATLLKAQVIARAALAPASPSAQDRNVAAQATALMQKARVDLALALVEKNEQAAGQHLDVVA